MRGYTERKTATINLSYASAASVFGFASAYFIWKWGSPSEPQWWQILRLLSSGTIAIAIAFFPIYWHFRPQKHPVRRAIGAHGDPELIGAALDREMESLHEVFGPFHFTETYLVYENGYTLNVTPYDRIVGAEVKYDGDGDMIVLTTRNGTTTYDWYSTWIQGFFKPSQVLARIQSAARLEVHSKQ